MSEYCGSHPGINQQWTWAVVSPLKLPWTKELPIIRACHPARDNGNHKRMTSPEESRVDGFSDRGSTPLISTTYRVQKRCTPKNAGFPAFFSFYLRFSRFFKNRILSAKKRCIRGFSRFWVKRTRVWHIFTIFCEAEPQCDHHIVAFFILQKGR